MEAVEVYKSGMGFLLNIFRELYSHRFVNSLFVMATVYFTSSGRDLVIQMSVRRPPSMVSCPEHISGTA